VALTDLVVPPEQRGQRLDRFLTSFLGGHSRSQLQKLIADGLVTVDGRTAKANLALRDGDRVRVELPEAVASEVAGEELPLEILYQDEDLAVVNKPAGMVVHPGAGNRSGTLVHALLHRDPSIAWPGQPERAGIVHRLDRDTSGVILVAKNVAALESLSKQFRERSIRKTYLAVVHGRVREAGRIDQPIGRHPTERKKMSVAGRPPRAAVSDYRPLEQLGAFTLVEVRPLTGRTHQIRVHLSAAGYPIVGDKLYGGKMKSGISRQALHAAAIELEPPSGGGRIRIEAPLAPDIEALLDRVRSAAPGR